MKQAKIRDLKSGDFFTLKPHEYPTEAQVWIRDEYDRSEKKFCCYKWNDVCHTNTFNGDKLVWTDFIF